jgi:O-succinylhomoserine sulfhydrylase
MTDKLSLETLGIRGGVQRGIEQEHAPAIYPTSSFVFQSAEEAAARFSGEESGNIYSRFTNPSVAAFERKLALMEEGERCVATASGMAAIMATCLGLLESGDHILCSRNVFGSIPVLFNKYFVKFGLKVDYVDLTDLDAWQSGITSKTKLLFVETPSNPLGEVADIQQLSKIAKQAGAKLVVDNCFCTPALQQPLKLGADLVIHSATKYLDGQGRCIGGAVVGDSETLEQIYGVVRTGGPSMSPFNAWVFNSGLETLALRMKAHCDNALAVAKWLEAHPNVIKVNYPGLSSHPGHELAKKQQSGFGGVLSFVAKGERDGAWKIINSTNLVSITANLGDVKTTITHPATTTHGRLSDEDKARSGIVEGLLRIAVGLESVDDIVADLAAGLDHL